MRYSAAEKAEVIRLVEQSHLPVRRTLEKLGIPRATCLTLVRGLPGRRTRGARGSSLPAQPGLEPPPRRGPRPHRRAGPGPARAVAARARGALHRRGAVLRLGSHRVPAAEGPRPDHQPGLRGDQGRGRVPRQDHGPQPALADRLHLPEGHRLGLVLPLHGARRLLALRRGLEALRHHAGLRRHRDARPGAGSRRARPDHRRPPAAPARPATGRATSPGTWPNGSKARE